MHVRGAIAASFASCAIACAGPPAPAPAAVVVVPPVASVSQAATASVPSPRPPVSPTRWSAPAGCAIHRTAATRNTLLRTEAQLRDFLRCKDGVSLPLDVTAEWLAVFSLQTEGGMAMPGEVHDDGKTLTLDVGTTTYCGGAAPRRIEHVFVYRVAPEPRHVRVNRRSADGGGPCPAGLP